MPLLARPRLHPTPWPLLTTEAALGPALARARAWVQADLAWVRHESFYRCWMADVPCPLDAPEQTELARALSAATSTPLTGPVTATLQRMEPGDHALPHTDAPRLGYEVARLVVQLDADWHPDDGGAFEALDARTGEVFLRRPPAPDGGVAFVMSPRSLHAVQPTRRTRHTLVLHLRHPGNDEAVAAYVRGLLDGLDLGALPAEVVPLAVEAEAQAPADATLRAGAVAWILARWGLSGAAAAVGYQAELGSPCADPAVGLARWVVTLWQDGFDAAAWADARDDLRPGARAEAAVAEAWSVCFGAGEPKPGISPGAA